MNTLIKNTHNGTGRPVATSNYLAWVKVCVILVFYTYIDPLSLERSLTHDSIGNRVAQLTNRSSWKYFRENSSVAFCSRNRGWCMTEAPSTTERGAQCWAGYGRCLVSELTLSASQFADRIPDLLTSLSNKALSFHLVLRHCDTREAIHEIVDSVIDRVAQWVQRLVHRTIDWSLLLIRISNNIVNEIGEMFVRSKMYVNRLW